MIFYAIRHKSSGELMPEVKTRGGYSHWNPDNPDMPTKIFHGHPRLFATRKRAHLSIAQWFACQNGRAKQFQSGYYGDEVDVFTDVKPDGRKKEDLEIVEVELVFK